MSAKTDDCAAGAEPAASAPEPKNQDPGSVETNMRPPAKEPHTIATVATRPMTSGRRSEEAALVPAEAGPDREASETGSGSDRTRFLRSALERASEVTPDCRRWP